MANQNFKAAIRRMGQEIHQEYLSNPRGVRRLLYRGCVLLTLIGLFWLPLIKMTFGTVIDYGSKESVGTIIDGHRILGLLDWTRWTILAMMIVAAEYMFIMRQVNRFLARGEFGHLLLSLTGRELETPPKFPGET